MPCSVFICSMGSGKWMIEEAIGAQVNHTIIYGHHTDTGHMFADFEKYLYLSFFEENKTVEIQDLYKKGIMK